MENDGRGGHVGLSDEARAAFAERLTRVLGADQTLTGPSVAAYIPRGRVPAVVARPTYAEGVRAAVALAFEAGAAIVPWGSGSRQALGYPPERCDLVISLERLTRIVAYDPADLTITLEAGMTHAALADRLASTRQILPLDPPLPARATIGGTAATAISGLRGTLYGDPRDLVLGLRTVDVSGQMTRAGGAVVKNSSGYAMRRLYTGSLGALAVITEISFKLAPAPESEATVIAACATVQQVSDVATRASQLATRPASVAALSATTLPELARLGHYREDEALVAVRLAGVAAAVARSAVDLERALPPISADHIMTLDSAATTHFWASINDFPALRTSKREALVRVVTLPTEIASALDVARDLAQQYDLTLHWLADMQAGTLWTRFWAPDATLSASNVAFSGALRATLVSLARRWPQTVLLACPDAYTANIPVWGVETEVIPLMRQVKDRFDPDSLLNPGRLVGRI
jgi:glycolate oxidase FAD binding subunit